ncbi:DUF4446 family protein [Paenibacillus protaetiae]|uniref:DUF4446 family protein n=1 Tax=Paenibacillus protaetiae TaxID=2509456 RepID=A0A4P6EZ09_9BACL|nr:DUF4446 family protein [Paenibacillus protaetiae]QAY67503.1 DUF4446 family protein [Paenibacillus protaetiae]
MEEWSSNPTVGAAVVIVIGVIIMVLWVSALGRKLKRLRKQYVEVMGSFGVSNMEEVITGLKQTIASQQQVMDRQQQELQALKAQQNEMKGKVSVTRYNAFSEQGNNLSFSIAVLNEQKDGYVLTGIYNRDNTYVYAKPIEKGESVHPLSPEERNAIDQAK